MPVPTKETVALAIDVLATDGFHVDKSLCSSFFFLNYSVRSDIFDHPQFMRTHFLFTWPLDNVFIKFSYNIFNLKTFKTAAYPIFCSFVCLFVCLLPPNFLFIFFWFLNAGPLVQFLETFFFYFSLNTNCSMKTGIFSTLPKALSHKFQTYISKCLIISQDIC